MRTRLEGVTVVNTRPTHQAKPLNDLIRQAGATLITFPVIEIAPLANTQGLQAQLRRAKEADLVIFISANAVIEAIKAVGGTQHWPAITGLASVGKATAETLESFGLTVNIIAPEPFNSEALLSLPELENCSGRKVLIIRGEGGREFLADTLRARGADVEYVECYRRVKPASDPVELYQCWAENRNPLIVVTSNEGLRHLIEMIDAEHQQDLFASTLVVVSERAVSLASELGFEQTPILASTASNEAIFTAIQHNVAQRKTNQ